jgi:hypothetical protein
MRVGRASLCATIALIMSFASSGVASADWSLPALDSDLEWALECLCHMMSSEASTQPTTQPSAPWSTPPTRLALASLQLPNSALLAAAPEPPATSYRPSAYDGVCSVADKVFNLNTNATDKFIGVLKDAATKGKLSEGLVVNMGTWAVSKACHAYAPKVVPQMINAAKHLLGLSYRRHVVQQLHGAERDLAWNQITSAAPRFAQYQHKTDRELPIIRLIPRTEAR